GRARGLGGALCHRQRQALADELPRGVQQQGLDLDPSLAAAHQLYIREPIVGEWLAQGLAHRSEVGIVRAEFRIGGVFGRILELALRLGEGGGEVLDLSRHAHGYFVLMVRVGTGFESTAPATSSPRSSAALMAALSGKGSNLRKLNGTSSRLTMWMAGRPLPT